MPEWTWNYDTATGTYKSHTISSKLREQAVVESVFADFVRTEPGFGRKKGETITIMRFDALSIPTSAALTETERIPIDTMTQTSVGITVYEYGRGVAFTHISQLLSKFDPEDRIQKALTEQMRKSLDRLYATAMKTVYLKYIPTSLTGGSFDEDGTASTSATSNLTVAHLAAIRDAFADTYIVPPYENGDYIGLISTKGLRGIKSDPTFETWKQYLREGDVLHNSEVGKIESIRCIEVKDTTNLANNKGTGSVLGEAVIFGDDFCVMAEVETPEVRAQVNMGQDFGRVHAAAWYGVLGAGLSWSATATAGKVKGVHVTSS